MGQRIAKLEKEFTNLRQEVGHQHTKNNELQTQNNELQTQMTTKNNELQAQMTKLEKLEKWKTDTEVASSDYTIQEEKALWSTLLLHFNTVLLFPVYKTIFRQQIHNITVREAMAQLYKEGRVNMFRGILPAFRMKQIRLIAFSIQGYLLNLLSSSPNNIPAWARPALAGLGAGVVEAMISTPFERVQNVLQNGKYNGKMPELRCVLQTLVGSERWALGFYRAFLPMTARSALGNGLFFGLKGPLYEAVEAQGHPMAWSFVSGTLTSMAVSLSLYPLSVLVANMQAEVGGERARERVGVMASWRKLWDSRKGSVAQLYRGSQLVILRSCISWGIINIFYNKLQRRAGRDVE